jgi:Phage integrase family
MLTQNTAASVKQNRLHRVPLSSSALELLRAMHSQSRSDRFVFPGSDPTKPVADIKKSWAAICARAGIEGVRLHDIRHTFASTLASGEARCRQLVRCSATRRPRQHTVMPTFSTIPFAPRRNGSGQWFQRLTIGASSQLGTWVAPMNDGDKPREDATPFLKTVDLGKTRRANRPLRHDDLVHSRLGGIANDEFAYANFSEPLLRFDFKKLLRLIATPTELEFGINGHDPNDPQRVISYLQTIMKDLEVTFHEIKNPVLVWEALTICRRLGFDLPEWVLKYLTSVGENILEVRAERTADRDRKHEVERIGKALGFGKVGRGKTGQIRHATYWDRDRIIYLDVRAELDKQRDKTKNVDVPS